MKKSLSTLRMGRETLRVLNLKPQEVMGLITSLFTCPRQASCLECTNLFNCTEVGCG